MLKDNVTFLIGSRKRKKPIDPQEEEVYVCVERS